MDYAFGNATGSKHNTDRSSSMASQLSRIGIHDTPNGRAVLNSHLQNVVKDPSNIAQIQVRSYIAKELPGQPRIQYTATTRDSLLMGPGGGLKVESVWDNNRLLTLLLKGGD
ncbi:hypothetical protein LJC58_08465 [Lachnospiraceae bacterium OttesenSCG-928-D06]|nr:hypothetical protein [Lachnospiraceae bacterium OttesenSCG-928-D06]